VIAAPEALPGELETAQPVIIVASETTVMAGRTTAATNALGLLRNTTREQEDVDGPGTRESIAAMLAHKTV